MLKIENEKYTVQVNTAGAELSGIYSKQEDYEYMWQGDPAVWTGRSPLLFPVVGRLVDDTYTLAGKKYTMEKHGFARNEVFEVAEHTDTSLSLMYSDYEKHFDNFPFKYTLTVKFVLDGDKLRVSHIVKNLGAEPMYFSLGAHPAFFCGKGAYLEFPEKENVRAFRFNDDKIIKPETDDFLDNDSIFKIYDDTFVDDAYVLEGLRSPYVYVRAPELGHSVKVNFGGAPFLGVWAKPAADYVCIEPWFGIDDDTYQTGAIEEKKGIVKLDAGCTFDFTYEIEPQ